MDEETVEISGFSWEVTAQLLQEKIDRVREVAARFANHAEMSFEGEYIWAELIKALDGEQ